MSNRIALTTNVSPKLVELVNRASRATDSKTAEYVRGAIVQRLKAEGHDLAAAFAGLARRGGACLCPAIPHVLRNEF
jgi:hypothetical protein